MKRQYMVSRGCADSDWFYGYVRYRKWFYWTAWALCTAGSRDRKEVESLLDKYEAAQPDRYVYAPKASA